MTRRWKYKIGLHEVLEKSEPGISEKEKQSTTIVLPQLVRIAMADLHEKHHRLSYRETTRRIIEHGFSLIEHKYKKPIKEVYELKKRLRYPKIKKLRNFIMDTKVSIDGLDSVARKSILLRKPIYSGISNVSEKLGIEMASVIRLCIYHSLVTSDELPEEVINTANEEIDKFIIGLVDTRATLLGFEYSERVKEEKGEEWIEEIEDEYRK